MPLHSMTAFAARSGAFDTFEWLWEVRGVNAKGLDLRVRVPDWVEGLEAAVRAEFSKALGRGNVQISLKVSRKDGTAEMALDMAALDRLLGALQTIEDRASAQGVALRTATAADIFAHRSLTDGASAEVPDGLIQALRADIGPLIVGFLEMRRAEGTGLLKVVTAQIDQIADLTRQAQALLPARAKGQKAALKSALARVLDTTDEIEPDRIAQELAVIAIKSDLAEELDRLAVHVTSARDLLTLDAPSGRKLDFLAQEFNREANTLCAKSGQSEMTRIGLDLKVAIDQMREQIQNVE